jgi:hypothetical protein
MDGEKLQLQLTHTRKKEWNQTLITKVNQTSAQIHKSTLRGGANFISFWNLCYLWWFRILQVMLTQNKIVITWVLKESVHWVDVTKCTVTLCSSYSIIVGHKGKSLLDTVSMFTHTCLQLTPTMYNPFNFAPKELWQDTQKKLLTIDSTVT